MLNYLKKKRSQQMFKKIAPFIIISFVLTSCADTFDSVKRGLTGAKKKSTDEFLVEKKDPLVLPPDFENLPTPDDRIIAQEEISSIEKTLNIESSSESSSKDSTPTEKSILKKIRKQ